MKQAVVGIIFSEDRQKVLIIKRRDVQIWVFPSGGVDAGETPEEAVIREVFEETGLHAEILRKVGVYSPINRLACLTYVFECKKLSGKLSTGLETLDLNYYSIEDLPHDFFFVHNDWLVDALQNLPEAIQKPIQLTYWKAILLFLSHPIRVLRYFLSRFGLPINKE